MSRSARYLLPLLLLLALCASAALAQGEEAEYMGSFNIFRDIVQTLIWSGIYIAFYAAALLLTLGYLRLFTGFETEMVIWVAALWVGGMAINAVAYGITHNHFIAVLIAMPLLFGWSVFINTRNFGDLPLPEATRVALVVMLVCAPYFGPTWRIHRAPKPTPSLTESSWTVPTPAPVTRLAA
ncbi:MAG TPA: hypothetical protein VGL77_08360 [Armatimonadota bacterium]|jgi:hypothetical protein